LSKEPLGTPPGGLFFIAAGHSFTFFPLGSPSFILIVRLGRHPHQRAHDALVETWW
jgi:hypothetical protein